MTREEMNEILTPKIREIEDHSRLLASAVEVLKRTMTQDINFAALEQASKLLEETLAVNIKSNIYQIRKTLGARAKQKLRELGAFR